MSSRHWRNRLLGMVIIISLALLLVPMVFMDKPLSWDTDFFDSDSKERLSIKERQNQIQNLLVESDGKFIKDLEWLSSLQSMTESVNNIKDLPLYDLWVVQLANGVEQTEALRQIELVRETGFYAFALSDSFDGYSILVGPMVDKKEAWQQNAAMALALPDSMVAEAKLVPYRVALQNLNEELKSPPAIFESLD